MTKKQGKVNPIPKRDKSYEEGIMHRGRKRCFYCGTHYDTPVDHDQSKCLEYNKPIYFSEYQMANLIAMYALGVRAGLIGGDCTFEIADKLQLWCKKYGFPRRNNLGMKIDESTYDDEFGCWLANIRESSTDPYIKNFLKFIETHTKSRF